MTRTGDGSRMQGKTMSVISGHGEGVEVVTKARMTTVDIASQSHGTTRKIESVAIDRNELETEARILETNAIDIEGTSEDIQILKAITQGDLGGNRRAHHCRIELVLLNI
jgi:hypothetical protein